MSGGSVALTILTGGAGQAAGSLVGPGAEAGKGIYQYLKRKYNYIKNLDQNFVRLDKEFGYLSSRQMDVRDKIANNRVLMEGTRECDTWLEDVGRTLESVEKLKARYRNAISSSCVLCLSNTRLKLSKEIVKMINNVVELRDRMDPDRVVLVERRPNKVEKKFPRNINEVPSLFEHVEKLLELLQDGNMKRIGVWGMSGVGKTTILENLNDAVEKLHIFDIVLWVTVSKKDNLQQIQHEIMKRLGLKVESVETEKQAESLISRSLENMKYLLLLDEVFYDFDLRHIGIHHSHVHGKVVLSAKEKKICNSMETDEDVKVERLSRDDARKLFRGVAGEAVDHPNIKPIADRVLKQCGELPHIIKAVGSFLKDKLSEDFWTSTLSKLQSPNMYPLQHMEDVFNSFKVIFDELHDTLKNCLLYAASFPEEHEIYRDYLIECWKAEQLIGIDETFRRTREEGHTNLDILIDKCLFDTSRISSNSVKMPIIFRNTALRIADQRKYGFLLKPSEELENHPVEKWMNAKVISLMNSNLLQLPSKPDCSVISTLFLQKNFNLSVVPTSFFDSMSTLRILDLCGTSIDFLPPSVSNLTNLKGLYLNNCCKLLHLPQEIENLRNLELLDIRRTGIHGLPAAIRGLIFLRCLRVSYTSVVRNGETNGIDVTPFETIQWLQHLEELTVDVNPKNPKWNMIAPKVAEQVAKLEKLSTLSFWFPSTASLETFIQTSKSWKKGSSLPGKNLRSFNIVVGSQGSRKFPGLDVSRCSAQRYFQYYSGKDTPPYVMKEVLRRTCAFELIGHENITIFSDFDIERMECLEFCQVQECNAMTTFLGSQSSATPAFPWLRELHLLNLKQLNAISRGPITPGSFARLTTLALYDCPSVTEVISAELAKELNELQHLNVEKCPQIQQIVTLDNQSTHPAITGAFPKLKTLKLVMLASLVRIQSDNSFEFLELQSLEIIQCDKLFNSSITTMDVAKLRRIQCNAAWWRTVVLNDEVKANLERFCSFS